MTSEPGVEGPVALVATHRPNYVTEGPLGTEFHRTRVKCEGESCDFYAEDPSWFRALEQHDAHLARVVQAYTEQRVGERVAEALEGAAVAVEQLSLSMLGDDSTPGERVGYRWGREDAAKVVRKQVATSDLVLRCDNCGEQHAVGTPHPVRIVREQAPATGGGS